MAKKIGAGVDSLFPKEKLSKSKDSFKEIKKEKLFCEINSDLKEKLQFYKIKNKCSLNTIVEKALEEFIKKYYK